MKYSLKNEYKELLKEEIVNIERFNPSRNEVWNIEIENVEAGVISNATKVNTTDPYYNKSMSGDGSDINLLHRISLKYSLISKAEIVKFFRDAKKKNENFKFRIKPQSKEQIIAYLNDNFKEFCLGSNKTKNAIGIGELCFHLAFETTNWNSANEPDVILKLSGGSEERISCKSFRSGKKWKDALGGVGRGSVKSGESKDAEEIRKAIDTIRITLKTKNNEIKSKEINDFCKNNPGPRKRKLLVDLSRLAEEIVKEHDTTFIAVWTGTRFELVLPNESNKFGITYIKGNRAHFVYKPNYNRQKYDTDYSQGGFFASSNDFLEFLLNDFSDKDQFDWVEYYSNAQDLNQRRMKNNKFKLELGSLIDKDYGKKVNIEKFFNEKGIAFNSNEKIDTKTSFYNLINRARTEFLNINQKERFESSSEMSGIWDEIILSSLKETQSLENSSYIPQGKVLKELYSNLFKKKLISEGGLAGHMMHPYEALDMTPRQIIDRIKEYSTSQKIIEKVDGQNLFFTVEQDGTLMFARNKEDMTHDDLVEKFTNHPAEVPFITGGNAIKKGVDQWLSSAGAFSQQEILDIFHPDGEARSFINFEIMHKDHPNQLEYGENFIVLHSIIDFVDGREAVYSSNNSQRLDRLIDLIKQGVESLGYTLASNRTVDLNKLTNVQVSHYVSRIKKVSSQLDITEDEFLGDGVEKKIKQQLDSEGIDISNEAIKMLYGFALYGEDKSGKNIKSKDFTSLMQPEDVKKLRSINLTSANKAAAKVRSILSPFKEIFVDLGIDLLDGVPSSYMDSETDLANIDSLRDKLETAIDDLSFYMDNTPESDWDSVVNRLKPHYDKVIEVGIVNTVSTSVEGGVYDYQGDLLKVTGGFAPLNQILGAAYRDKKGIFPTFKEKFIQQESNRRSLKAVFNLIF